MIRRFDLACAAILATLLTTVAASAAEYNTDVKSTPLMSWSKTIASPSSSNLAPTAVAKQVDKLLAEDLSAKDAGKAPKLGRRANDDVFLRRSYLDLVGRNPSPEEVTAFVLDPSADKRTKLIDRLLDDPRFGENWGRYWRDVIMYRRSDDRGQIAGPALAEYLTEAFNKNTHWDEIARAFITATGDVRENGATGLIMAQNGNTADITSEVSRIFLGIQIQCANCHDHKSDRWKREEFHQLAAFFPRVGLKRPMAGDQVRSFEVYGNNDPERPGRMNAPLPRGNPEHLMPDLDHPERRGTRMQPVFFLTGEKVNYGSTDAVRRATIAVWITSPTNEWFAKALVNRIWAELVGEGFYDPVDDIGPDRDCSAPKTIDYLAHQFADSQFDIKRLYRIIAGTEAYQRESKSRRNPDGTPFAANCPQRLRGDQLYDALIAALGMREGPLAGRGGGAQGRPQLRSPRNQFDQVFGFDPSTPRDEVTGSIPQALMLMNGQQINQAISGTRRNTDLARLLATTSDNDDVATELYLRCLGREPNKAELQTCLTYVKRSQNRATGFEDILWALVNSTEFSHRK